jgi:hypothetical protein
MGTLNNSDGTKSSRRVMGVISLIVGLSMIGMAFLFEGLSYPPFDLLLLVFGSGFALLGITTFDHYFKNLKP